MIANFDNLHNFISSTFLIHFLNHLFTFHSKCQHTTTPQYTTTIYFYPFLSFTWAYIHLSPHFSICSDPPSYIINLLLSLRLMPQSQSQYYISLPVLHLRQVSTSYLIYPTHPHRLLPIYPILPNRGNKKTITQNLPKICRGSTKY